jgi:hypothetical protein
MTAMQEQQSSTAQIFKPTSTGSPAAPTPGAGRTSFPVILQQEMATPLLFYNSSSGLAQFYSTDGQGGISQLSSSTYSRGWTLIIPCRLGLAETFTDLLFYDHNRRVGEFYTPDGQGGINLLSSHTGWRTSWAEIVSIDLLHP